MYMMANVHINWRLIAFVLLIPTIYLVICLVIQAAADMLPFRKHFLEVVDVFINEQG